MKSIGKILNDSRIIYKNSFRACHSHERGSSLKIDCIELASSVPGKAKNDSSFLSFKVMEYNHKILYTTLILCGLCLNSFSQALSEIKNSKSNAYYQQTDSLPALNSSNTQIPPICKTPTLLALSHYPELINVKIVFIEKSIKTSAACRPKWTFLLQRRKNRIYKIYINNNPEKIKGAMFNEVPFDAQIGLIGHELGHIVDYSHRGVFGIISLGVKYLSIQSRSQIEKRVDSITIAHHLGWQLYEFDDFVLNRSKASDAYKNYKRKVYYKPEELLKLMEKQ